MENLNDIQDLSEEHLPDNIRTVNHSHEEIYPDANHHVTVIIDDFKSLVIAERNGNFYAKFNNLGEDEEYVWCKGISSLELCLSIVNEYIEKFTQK